MFAVTAARFSSDDPLSALELGEHAEPVPPDGWTTVSVKAASLNHHDVWTLRGVGISADRLPMILGCDAAGVDADGNEVVVHGVVSGPGAAVADETLDPARSLLSERYDGTFAEQAAVPRGNLVPKPAGLSFTEAACLPTAYLSAFRMLFDKSGVEPGSTVLVQGAGGGVATALILLGSAPGYRIVISGATSGAMPPADLARVFFRQLSVVGSTMGTRDQLTRLLRFCEQTGARPLIDRTLPISEARHGFAAMINGELFGKVVFTV